MNAVFSILLAVVFLTGTRVDRPAAIYRSFDPADGVITILPGQQRDFVKDYTFDAVTAARIWKYKFQCSPPSFITCADTSVRQLDAYTIRVEYRISVAADAPGGTHRVEITIIFADLQSNEVTRKTLYHDVNTGQVVLDDHGNDCASATDTGLNDTVHGSLETAGDKDYFRLSVPGPGTLSASTTGSTDTVGTLHGAGCVVLQSDDDGGEGSNFSISAPVESGDHYISVRHFGPTGTGAYVLSVAYSPEPQASVEAVYPQLALGGGYEAIVFLSNAATSAWQGAIRLCRGSEEPWETPWALNGVDQTGSTEFDVELSPDATGKFVLTSTAGLSAGYLEVLGSTNPASTKVASAFFYNLYVGGRLVDSVGMPPAEPGTRFVFPVEKAGGVDTGLAWAPAGQASGFDVHLTLFDASGEELQSRTVQFQGHQAQFFSELFSAVEDSFVGMLLVESGQPIELAVLRLETTLAGLQLTSVPPTRLDPAE